MMNYDRARVGTDSKLCSMPGTFSFAVMLPFHLESGNVVNDREKVVESAYIHIR